MNWVCFPKKLSRMGLSVSRKVPLSKISSKMLTNSEMKTKSVQSSRVQVLSPELCSAIFRTHPSADKIRCRSDEIEAVKKFLSRSSNFEVVQSRDVRSKVKLRKVSEKELLKAIRDNRKVSRSHVTFSGNADDLLKVILDSLKTEPRWTTFGRKNRLLTTILFPELKTLTGRSSFEQGRDFILSVFLRQLKVGELRKNLRVQHGSEGTIYLSVDMAWLHHPKRRNNSQCLMGSHIRLASHKMRLLF